MRWERLEPNKPCTSPDGHDHVDVVSGRSRVPWRIFCSRCGERWSIIVFAEDVPGGWMPADADLEMGEAELIAELSEIVKTLPQHDEEAPPQPPE